MIDRRVFFSAILLCCILMLPVFGMGQNASKGIVIGHSIQLQSKILNEEREILIYLPENYAQRDLKFPVLYLLDGDLHFHHVSGIVRFLARTQRIPQMIVVAIANTDRMRDFTPKHLAHLAASGGADNFLNFLKTELFPFIEQRYRVSLYRILAGHSLCGMFTAYALLTRPEMFDAYISIGPGEPSVTPEDLVGDRFVLDYAEKTLNRESSLRKILFLTAGDREPEANIRYSKTLTGLFEQKAPRDLVWKYEILPDETHFSMVHKSIYDGLEMIYCPLREMPVHVLDQGAEAVWNYYKEIYTKFGYEGIVPEERLNAIGYLLVGQNNFEKAIEVFKMNVQRFPNSANVYDSLGEAYERSGQLELAQTNYEKACKNSILFGLPNASIFKNNLDRVEQRLKAKMP